MIANKQSTGKTGRKSLPGNGNRPSDDAESSSASGSGLVLDPTEVMKAMMAAQNGSSSVKGKGREMILSEASELDEGSDSGSEQSDDESEDGRRLGSSSSHPRQNGLKRARSSTLSEASDSEEDDNEEGQDIASSALAASASSSRINLPSRTAASSTVNRPSTSKTINSKADAIAVFDSNPKPSIETTFASLGLSQPLINALAGINIRKPTEIQSACVGPIMSGRDCIGGAKTGSGKTMAFALPIVERIARDPFGVWAVVLTPTRELAYQLSEQFLVVGKPLGLTTVTIVGGMDMMAQAKELEGRPHIIVATPGRLCDLIKSDPMSQGKLGRVRTLVLDEADRLLTPTFAPELAYLFSQIPPKRQTCLFTATVSGAIMDLANKPPAPGKEKPFVYRVESDTMTVSRLKQKYLFIPSQIRDPYLLYLLQHPPEDIDVALRVDPKKEKRRLAEEAAAARGKKGKKLSKSSNRSKQETEGDEDTANVPSTIIFTQRCATAHLLHLLLNSLDIPSVPLHSHLTQPQRLLSLARFRAREVPVLVTTDVGSRGLDIPEVALVINWDCPRRSDDYVHRVGRTARAGRGGVAITVVTERDVELVKMIEEEINVNLEELELPEEEVLEGLNKVSLARRMATMEMHDSGFGERQAINKAKAIKRQRRDAAAKA
ncbi:ATP-dependent RNA helicase DBP8 [Kwoniella heveanensis CBS 569]|nr:ATP-dependent RNA helicase DBP8 [Kwoniella heveanensis CBS 569]